MASKARDFVARFLTDTTKFDTSDAVDELDDLGDASEQTARKMDQSFDRIKRSSDDNLDDLGSSGKVKAREAGNEVGAEFAENMGEAFRSGDVGALITESLTSLAPALGAAGIGLGIGVALVTNMIKGTKERAAKLSEAVQNVVDNIEVDWTTFAAKFDAASFLNDSIAGLTKSDKLEDDIREFQRLAAATVGQDTLTHILAGQGSPEDRAALQAMVDTAVEQMKHTTGQAARQGLLDRQKAAEQVLALLDDQTLAYERGVDAVHTQIDAQKSLAGYIRTTNGLLDQASVKAMGIYSGKKLPTDDR